MCPLQTYRHSKMEPFLYILSTKVEHTQTTTKIYDSVKKCGNALAPSANAPRHQGWSTATPRAHLSSLGRLSLVGSQHVAGNSSIETMLN